MFKMNAIVRFAAGALFVFAAVTATPPLTALAESPSLGLQLRVPQESLRFRRESEGGIPVLVISGEILNPHYQPQPIPPMVIVLLDKGGLPLRSERIKIDGRTLEGGKRLPFQTSIPNAPPESVAVRISFEVSN